MNLNPTTRQMTKMPNMIQLHDYDILHVLLSGNGQQAGGVVIFLVQGHKKLSNHGSSNFRRDLKKLGATFAN